VTNQYAQNICLSIADIQVPELSKSERQEPRGKPVKAAENDKNAAPGLRLSHSRLMLKADQASVFGGRATTPEPGWAIAVFLIALCAYAACLYERWTVWDVLGPLAIMLFCGVVWRFTRRPAPSISQGYWSPSQQFAGREPSGESWPSDKLGVDE
jgi:hypothetical protein